MWCCASTRAIAYSRPERSLAETPSSQRWARSSGRSVTRGVIGNDCAPGATRGRGSARAAGPVACSASGQLGLDQRDQVAVVAVEHAG